MIEIDEYDFLNLLMERVRFWTDDPDVIELYEKMYESTLDAGCFEGGKLSVMDIVDNDYVNWCTTITPEDEHFDEIVKAYKDGERDISLNHWGYGFVEAVNENETLALVRY